MGSNCSCSSDHQNQPICIILPSQSKSNAKPLRNRNQHITLIQSHLHKLLSIKRTKTVLSSLITESRKQTFSHQATIAQSQIEAIRWSQLIQIEQDFNNHYGKYKDTINTNDLYTHSKVVIYPNDAMIYQSLIYEGEWRYDPSTNTHIPYGIGSIVKQTGLKVESFFDDLTPIAPVSRLYYPNGRIYVGRIAKMSSQYFPHGYGQLYLSTGFFTMNFDNGLPKGDFTFEALDKEYIAKGVFSDNKIRKDIEIIYADGTNYKGPFDFDNKNFTPKNDEDAGIIKEGNPFEHEVLYDYLSFYDIATLQRIPNKIIQEKIKKRSMNLKQSHYMSNNKHITNILASLHCILTKPEEVIKDLNLKRFIPISAYETNGGITDYKTHFNNIFNPSPEKVFFSNFLYDQTRTSSNVFIKAILNHSMNKDLQGNNFHENPTEIISLYDSFMHNYTFDYYKKDIFNENIIKICSTTGKTDYLFSINEVVIDITINPSLHVVLTNPVKCFAVFITHESFAQRDLDEFIRKDEDIEGGKGEIWEKYIDVKQGDVCPVNRYDGEDCFMVEFDSENRMGLFLFVEMKEYNRKIRYACQRKFRHIGKEINIVLYDQNVIINKAAKCSIDFGTIMFNGNIIEIQSK